MFTGLIHSVGVVTRSHIVGRDLVFSINIDSLSHESIDVGESIAIDGVCLTVNEVSHEGVGFEVSAETLGCTVLGRKVVGDRVNIEQSLLPNTRLGGHFVTGHVDGVGAVTGIEAVGHSIKLRFKIPGTLVRFVTRKGSICVDGVSLTVNSVLGDQFEVNIIPHTAQTTTMGDYREGQPVHIEVDLIARYVDRMMTAGKIQELDVDRTADKTQGPDVDRTADKTQEPDVDRTADKTQQPDVDRNTEKTQEPEEEQITREFLTDRGFNPPNIDH